MTRNIIQECFLPSIDLSQDENTIKELIRQSHQVENAIDSILFQDATLWEVLEAIEGLGIITDMDIYLDVIEENLGDIGIIIP